MSNTPPPHVAAAAAVVNGWLNQVEKPTRVSDSDFARMSAAERLDYARQFDQSQHLARGTRT
jgi:hypothetical protein